MRGKTSIMFNRNSHKLCLTLCLSLKYFFNLLVTCIFISASLLSTMKWRLTYPPLSLGRYLFMNLTWRSTRDTTRERSSLEPGKWPLTKKTWTKCGLRQLPCTERVICRVSRVCTSQPWRTALWRIRPSTSSVLQVTRNRSSNNPEGQYWSTLANSVKWIRFPTVRVAVRNRMTNLCMSSAARLKMHSESDIK